ncbi:MAG: substrate-binding domain-containing protein, partial [Proteobacteria bacterium]|nr:substrate-binding domain-containing protein [Pseudomonadota bacterium]
VVANSRKAAQVDLTRKDLFLALAKDIMVDGKVVPNPNKTWKDVNPALPAIKIEVMGPPPTSGTRDAFVELVMDKGCGVFPAIKAMAKSDKKAYRALCRTMREDGGFVEAGENDNLIVQKLNANPDAFGIFGYSFLDQNSDTVQGSKINGVEPAFEKIASGDYTVSRPLFFYVKKAHIGKVPGIKEFMAEFTADSTWGNEGYLTDKGLIPLGDDERKTWHEKVMGLANLSM